MVQLERRGRAVRGINAVGLFTCPVIDGDDDGLKVKMLTWRSPCTATQVVRGTTGDVAVGWGSQHAEIPWQRAAFGRAVVEKRWRQSGRENAWI